jgi:hypothetical protein
MDGAMQVKIKFISIRQERFPDGAFAKSPSAFSAWKFFFIYGKWLKAGC